MATSAALGRHAVADLARRPRAWGVLAVSLALMALVTALSSRSDHPGAAQGAAAHEPARSGQAAPALRPRPPAKPPRSHVPGRALEAVGPGSGSVGRRAAVQGTGAAGGKGAPGAGASKGARGSAVGRSGAVAGGQGSAPDAGASVGGLASAVFSPSTPSTPSTTTAPSGAAPGTAASGNSAPQTTTNEWTTRKPSRAAASSEASRTASHTATQVSRSTFPLATSSVPSRTSPHHQASPTAASSVPSRASPHHQASPTAASSVPSRTSPHHQASPTAASSVPKGTGTAAAPGTWTSPEHGRIEAPSTSVSYAAAGGGTVSVGATWTGAATLELEIACPGGVSVARTGSSGLSLEVDDSIDAATCMVTLSLPPGVHADVSYTLVVQPTALAQ